MQQELEQRAEYAEKKAAARKRRLATPLEKELTIAEQKAIQRKREANKALLTPQKVTRSSVTAPTRVTPMSLPAFMDSIGANKLSTLRMLFPSVGKVVEAGLVGRDAEAWQAALENAAALGKLRRSEKTRLSWKTRKEKTPPKSRLWTDSDTIRYAFRRRDIDATSNPNNNPALWSPYRKRLEAMLQAILKRGADDPAVQEYDDIVKAREMQPRFLRSKSVRLIVRNELSYAQINAITHALIGVAEQLNEYAMTNNQRKLVAHLRNYVDIFMANVHVVRKDALFNCRRAHLAADDAIPTLAECMSVAEYLPEFNRMVRKPKDTGAMNTVWFTSTASLRVGKMGRKKVKAARVVSYLVNGNPFCYFPRDENEKHLIERFCVACEELGVIK